MTDAITLQGDFRVRGVAPPTIVRLAGQFALLGVLPSVLVTSGGVLKPVAQRVMTDAGWYPPVI